MPKAVLSVAERSRLEEDTFQALWKDQPDCLPCGDLVQEEEARICLISLISQMELLQRWIHFHDVQEAMEATGSEKDWRTFQEAGFRDVTPWIGNISYTSAQMYRCLLSGGIASRSQALAGEIGYACFRLLSSRRAGKAAKEFTALFYAALDRRMREEQEKRRRTQPSGAVRTATKQFLPNWLQSLCFF